MCPPGSLHDQIVKQWPYVRSYVMRDGHLFMSLMADGGIYELEPRSSEGNTAGTIERTVRETTMPLQNTYWKLTHLGDAPVTGDFSRAEPHLTLNTDTHRAAGSGGCNQFGGGYELSGARLKLEQVVSTMMACMKGMKTEQAFLRALEQVSGWRIAGKQLELTDAGGKVLARFDGRHME